MEEQIGRRVRAQMKEALPGVSQAEVAAKVSIPADAFSRSLNGKRAFSAVELVELAKLLGTSAHWLVTGEPDPFTVKFAGRHTFNHETKEHEAIDWDSERRPLEDVALAYLQAYGDSSAPTATVPNLSADETRARLQAASVDNFVRHLADLVESEFGVDVVRIPNIDRGFALEVLGRRVIVVGETGSWFFENWSIAHELSHVMRGELSERGDSACDDPAAEARANRFAAELLLPKELLITVDWTSASDAEVAQFVWNAGVSTLALRTRLTAVGLKTSEAVDLALKSKTQTLVGNALERVNGFRDPIAERMQAAAARRFPAHLIATHRSRAAEGTLRVDTLAWMLGVDRDVLASELAPALEPIDVDWLAEQLGFPVKPGE